MRIEITRGTQRVHIQIGDDDVRVRIERVWASGGYTDPTVTCTDPDCVVSGLHATRVCRNLDDTPARCGICGLASYPHKHPAEPGPGEGYTEYLGPLDLAGPYRHVPASHGAGGM